MVTSHAELISIAFIGFLTIGPLQLALQDTGLSMGSCEHPKVVHARLYFSCCVISKYSARCWLFNFIFNFFSWLRTWRSLQLPSQGGLCPSCEVQEKRLAGKGICKQPKVKSSQLWPLLGNSLFSLPVEPLKSDKERRGNESNMTQTHHGVDQHLFS